MLQKSVQVIFLLFSLFLTATVFAQEEAVPVNPSLEANNLYLVENQWGGDDAAWQPGGLWVLGAREGQTIVAVNIESADDGATLEGEITYAGEGPIGFRAVQEYTNTYSVQEQWGGDAANWNPDSLWVIGGRVDQPLVAANLTLSDEGKLTGEITYAGEGPISFQGTPVDGGVFYTENQWGADDAEWNPGGVWVLGGRPDQQVASVAAESADEGMTLEGKVTYEGEGPIGFRATHLVSNVYIVENQWSGDDSEWQPGGYWLLGGRDEQKVVGIDIAAVDNSLEGTITYAGEGPIRFTGASLQTWKPEAAVE